MMATKDRFIIGILDGSLSRRVRNDHSVMVFDCRNNVPILFPPFHIHNSDQQLPSFHSADRKKFHVQFLWLSAVL